MDTDHARGVIGRSFGESKDAGLKTVQKILPVVALLTGIAVFGIMIFGPYVLHLFYGDKFAPAVPVLQILMFLPLVIGFSNLMGVQIMLNLGMDKLFFRITCCGAVLSIFLNFLMIKRWGYIGTSINWILTETLICIAMFLVLKGKGINPIKLQYFKFSEYKSYYQSFRSKPKVGVQK
ncbi:MAG: hypothetical protein EOO43_03430 [Flavobacterium sp.]|nr:MAG: hypothetical protein EOO43_03430 [Flavobacterium sp.]